MKTLAFVIALCIVGVGAVGILAPGWLVWLAEHAISPGELYFIGAVRIAFGVLLLSVASTSRAPRTLRIIAIVPIIAGILLPFIGVERASAIITWWSHLGPGVVRVTGAGVLALGGFFAYACAPQSLTSHQ